MKWRQFIACIVSVALVLTQTSANAQSHQMGVEAGQAANAGLRGQVNATRAGQVLPGYGTPAPQTAYSGQPNVGAQANALLEQCRATPNNPNCQALTTAINSANAPRTNYSISDPVVRDARGVMRNPNTTTISNLASYYSSCTVGSASSPASTDARTCVRYTGSGPLTCSNQLAVNIEKTSSCQPGEWFASASNGDVSLATQCRPGFNGKQQHFRLMNGTNELSFFDVDMTATAIFPKPVGHYDIRPGFFNQTVNLYAADRSCNDTTCSLSVLIEEPQGPCTAGAENVDTICQQIPIWIPAYGACSAGSVAGDTLALQKCATVDVDTGEQACSPGGPADLSKCFVTSATPTQIISGPSGPINTFWKESSNRPVVGWALNPDYRNPKVLTLNYPKPTNTVRETDTWVNNCPTVSAGRCSVVTPPRCVDGPSKRTIDGVEVTRDCWKQEQSMQCTGSATADQCAQLSSQGCTATGESTCIRADATTGACLAYQDKYSCPVSATSGQNVTNCAADVFCVGTSCFNTKAMADGDMARSMSMLEAAREAGTYLDTDHMRIFTGVADNCRRRLLVNCCDSDNAGKGMTNQSSLGLGTKLVYDVLFDSDNRKFIMQAIQGYLSAAGLVDPNTSQSGNGTFSLSYYGVTASYSTAATGVAAGEATGVAAAEAGDLAVAEAFADEYVLASTAESSSVVIYTYTTEAGSTFTLAFDPWTLVIAIVIAIILAAAECSEQEALLAMREGAGLCHSVGRYCSSCFRVLGHCVTCVSHTTGKCCFNSMIARIINQQGRTQIGKTWGTPESPDCSGFTLDQLVSLNFGTMDLSEFYASIVPNAISFSDTQNRALDTPSSCYYGQGRCR